MRKLFSRGLSAATAICGLLSAGAAWAGGAGKRFFDVLRRHLGRAGHLDA